MTTAKKLWQRMHCAASGDEGSLPLAMLVILVGIGLSAALAPAAIVQRRSTTFAVTRVHEINAAQAAVDVVVGKIRNAVDSSGTGDPSQLPCTTDSSNNNQVTPIIGTVDNGTASYSVTVDYFVSDPVAHPGATRMLCVPGEGPYDTTARSVTPGFARITASGYDTPIPDGGSAGRQITSIYALQVDNSNISGGTIRVYPASADGANQYCLDTGSGTPTDNSTRVYLQPCSTTYPPASQQVFAYRTDLTLQLVSSVGTTVNGVTYRNGLCIDDTTFNSYNTAPASGTGLVLKQCGALGSPVWSQQWSFDDHSSLQAPTSGSASTGSLSGLCMTVSSTHTSGQAVTLGTCDSNLTSPTDAWIPSPSVGAGAASSPSSNQWINFAQFGRCINLPNNDPNALYLIAPTCKQNPKLASVSANQKLFYNATTKWFYVTLNGTNYCLYSSDVAYTTGGTNGRIQVTTCFSNSLLNGISQSQLQWVRTTPTTTNIYSQQYRFIDSTGLCMSLASMTNVPGDSASYNASYSVWPKLITATCDNSTLQQWNANNNQGNSSIENTKEN